MKILIVDDHLIFLEALESFFRAQPDFTVVGTASSVFDVVTRAIVCKPDLILMDFMLEDGTGLEATDAVLAQLPETKIVFLTALDEDEHLFEAIRHGAVGYLLKNTPSAEMLAYLRGVSKGNAAISPRLTSRLLKEFSKLDPRESGQANEHESVLTPRQREVLQDLKKGYTNRQIAEHLVISEQTVKNHVSQILEKLNLKDRNEVRKLNMPS